MNARLRLLFATGLLCAATLASAADNATKSNDLGLLAGLPVKLVDPPKPAKPTDTQKKPDTKADDKPSATVVPGLPPPLVPPGTVTEPAMATSATSPPPSATDQALLRSMVDAQRKSLVQPVKPPPHDILVKPGVTEIFPISIGRVNRLITPFPDPIIRSNRPREEVSRTGNIITVGTSVSDDVSLFVWDRSDPQTAISVQLLPRDIPPVEVKLDLANWKPVHPGAAPSEEGTAWETEQPYVESVKTLFRELAQGKVPSGYGLEDVNAPAGTGAFPACRWPGVKVTYAQRMEGHVMVALVARAVNVGGYALDLNEDACATPSVLAVATWPRNHLGPGEDTEVYIALRRATGSDSLSQRPSLLRHPEP